MHYNSLLVDQANHAFIFDSLLHRAYDVYGQIDKKKALAILSKPKVDTETEKLYIAERLLKTIGVPQGIK